MKVQRSLRDIRNRSCAVQDELSNITSSSGLAFGADLPGISARFHLQDWHRSIDEKLKTLEQMYHPSARRSDNALDYAPGSLRRATVCFFFVVDLIKSFFWPLMRMLSNMRSASE